MQERIEQLVSEAQSVIGNAADLQALDEIRVQYLGKKGLLTEELKQLGKLPAQTRREAGQIINRSRDNWMAGVQGCRQRNWSGGWRRRRSTLPSRGAVNRPAACIRLPAP